MSVPYTTTKTWIVRPDLDVEVNDGQSAPSLYLAGVPHNVATVEQYIDALHDAIKQLHEWYPGWGGWGDDGDRTIGATGDWGDLLKDVENWG